MLRLIRGLAPPAPADTRADEYLELLHAVRRGDRRASQTYLTAMAPHILSAVRRTLGSQHEDVEDVAQEAMMHALSAVNRFEGRSTVVHFVRRIALLTALAARRRNRASKRFLEGGTVCIEDDEPATPEASPERRLEEQRDLALIRRALDELPQPQAEALGLHCVLGYSVAEIAELEGLPDETIRSRLRAVRRSLRELVGAKLSTVHSLEAYR